jgi:hypothetical protein
LSILCLMELMFQVAMRMTGQDGCGAVQLQLSVTNGTRRWDNGLLRRLRRFYDGKSLGIC